METDNNHLPENFLDYVEQNPLLMFSIYTDLQVKTVRNLGLEITQRLDNEISSAIDAEGFQKSYGLFWLWTLGAYEVVRTMTQAEECFSAPFHVKLSDLKKRLAKVRMPLAKQELRGKKAPVSTELYVTDLDPKGKDFSFTIEEEQISVRRLISDFLDFFDAIDADDIVADHRSSYGYR